MSPIDPITQFATQHLGGRAMPDDLRRLLNLQWRDAASGRSNGLLKDAGVTFLDGGRMPGLVAAVCAGRDDLEGAARLACAQAMGDMVRYSAFVAEDAAGDAIGYWFSPDRIPIETSPLLRFDTDGNFSILPGIGVAEAILVIASRDNNLTFSKLRDYLNEQGLNITARTIQDVQRRECSLLPQATYQQLIQAYSADLLATSVSDAGGSVNIMTIHRGPKKLAPKPTRLTVGTVRSYSLVCWEEHQRLHQFDNLLPREPEKCECSSLRESSEESQLWMFSTGEKGR